MKYLALILSLALPLLSQAGTVAIPVNQADAPALLSPNPYTGNDAWLEGVAVVNDNGDFGGGVVGSYFFTKYVGVSTDVTYINESIELGGNLVGRIPLTIGVAPFASVGYGYRFADVNETGYIALGGGLSIALDKDYAITAGCRYQFADHGDDAVEFTLGIGRKF